MRPEKTAVSAVRVEVGVGVSGGTLSAAEGRLGKGGNEPVVCAMASGPPLDGAFDGTGSSEGEEVLEREGRGVRAVGPEPVVAGGDSWRANQSQSEFPVSLERADSPRPV